MYKLTVISDIHRDIVRLERLIPKMNATDCAVCCGDGAREFLYARGRICVPTVCVRGNNDFDAVLADAACIDFGGVNTFVAHGHKYGVKRGLDALSAAAARGGCKLALFGHTHVFFDGVVNGMRLINPGALCCGSYAVVEIDGDNIDCKRFCV